MDGREGLARNTRGGYKSEKVGRNYAKCGCNKDESLPIPGSDAPPDRIFTFPFLRDSATVDYLKKHNRIMFIIRGPSGTGKETLSSMIASLYPESDVISAKLYYSLPLAERRTRFNARKSHAWCRRRAEDGCKENKPILIIRNTNVRRWEFQPYLKLAKDFQYTVIFADCSKKFCFDPEILAKSNTQGLDAEYFETRLKQWEEVIPWYTGWFLGPADVRWLRDKSTNLLKEITAGKSALGISSDLNYQDETQLFCISTYCGCENSHHFLDCQVQNELGKMFYVTIIGFLIAPDVMAAVVKLTPGQVKISEIGKDFLRDEASVDILSHAVRSVSVGSSNNEGSNVVNATNQSVSTAHSEKQEGNMAVENVSYVVVKRSRTATFPYITNTDAFNRAMYSEVAEEGFIPSHKFSRLEDVAVCQIRKDVWLVFPPEKYTLQSVFTGYF